MNRREFITLLGGAAVAWPLTTRAQQPAKIARIGFMRATGPNEKEFNAFRSGLYALGYLEGQNIVIEQRYAAGAYDRLGELAAQLVRLEMDVIAVDGTPAAKAAKGQGRNGQHSDRLYAGRRPGGGRTSNQHESSGGKSHRAHAVGGLPADWKTCGTAQGS